MDADSVGVVKKDLDQRSQKCHFFLMQYEQSLCFELGIKTKINCITPKTKLRRFMILILQHSVADPVPGSGAFLTPGSGIRNRFFRISDPGSWMFVIFHFKKKLDDLRFYYSRSRSMVNCGYGSSALFEKALTRS
jgi:hypothetical protein